MLNKFNNISNNSNKIKFKILTIIIKTNSKIKIHRDQQLLNLKMWLIINLLKIVIMNFNLRIKNILNQFWIQIETNKLMSMILIFIMLIKLLKIIKNIKILRTSMNMKFKIYRILIVINKNQNHSQIYFKYKRFKIYLINKF